MPSRTLIVRERLIARLEAAMDARIAVIDAPAGFGKSTLLEQLLHSAPREHVFYQVPARATLARFARGLADALSARAPGARLAFASAYGRAAQSKQPSADLAYWMIEHVKGAAPAIVIDELNAPATDPAVMDFLCRVIDGTHETCRWTVATRASGMLRIPSWMAHGLMDRPLETAELRFDAGEALAFGDCGTWPAGADFRRAMQERTGAAAPPLADGDYASLATRIFEQLGADERRLLERTCYLSKIDPRVASRVAGFESETMFASLRTRFPWVFARGATPLRYHDRFQAYLEDRLAAAGPVATREAAERLADAFDAEQHVSQRLALLTRHGLADKIAPVLAAHGFKLIENGHAETVDAALALLDRRTTRFDADVMAVRGMLDSRLGRSDTSEAWYQLALEALNDAPRRADIAYQYARSLVRGYRHDWIPMLEPHADATDVAPDVRAMRLSLLAQGYAIAGRRDGAARHMRHALDLIATSNDDATRATVYGRAAFVALSESDASKAKSFAVTAAELAVARGLYDVAAPLYSVLFAIAYDLEDDAVASLTYVGRIADYSVKAGNIQLNLWALAARYGLLIEAGDESAAEEIETALQSFDVHYMSPAFTDALLPSQALRAAWRGQFRHAHELLAPSAPAQSEADRRALRFAEVALYAAAAGLADDARAALAGAAAAIEACGDVSPRSVRAELATSLTLAYLEDFEEAARVSQRAVKRAALTLRTRALADAVDAFAAWWRDGRGRFDLARSLRRLSDLRFGGLVRAIEALPLASARADRMTALRRKESA